MFFNPNPRQDSSTSAGCSIGGTPCLLHIPQHHPTARTAQRRERRAESLLYGTGFNQLFSVLLQRALKCHRKVKEEFRAAVSEQAPGSPAALQTEKPLCTTCQALTFIISHYFGEFCVLAHPSCSKLPLPTPLETLQLVTNVSSPVYNQLCHKPSFSYQKALIRYSRFLPLIIERVKSKTGWLQLYQA